MVYFLENTFHIGQGVTQGLLFLIFESVEFTEQIIFTPFGFEHVEVSSYLVPKFGVGSPFDSQSNLDSFLELLHKLRGLKEFFVVLVGDDLEFLSTRSLKVQATREGFEFFLNWNG